MANLTLEAALSTWREEILDYLKEMGRFKEINDPVEILRTLSGFSARGSYMNNQIGSSTNRKLIAFKIEEVQPFLKETDFQFRVWSRIGALFKDEWEMTK